MNLFIKLTTAITLYFFSLYVFIIPKYLGFVIPNIPFTVTCILWTFIVLSQGIYIILNIQWVFNLNIKSQNFINVSKVIFFTTLTLGTIASCGFGLILTAPAILLSMYLLFIWHPIRLSIYQQHKIRARTFSGNKNRLLAKMHFKYPM